jgi:hypothetical protein
MSRMPVTDLIGLGMARTEGMLFGPIVKRKWLTIGVAAWFATINEWRGLGFSLHVVPHYVLDVMADPTAFAQMLETQLTRVLLILSAITLVLFCIYLAFRWVSCRGQFMLLEAVVNGGLVVKESWRRHRELGNSLLKFRIGWDLLVFNLFLLVGVIAAALVWPDFRPMLDGHEFRFSSWSWAAMSVGILGMVVVGLFATVAAMFIDHVMVPVMFVRKLPAKAAFRHSRRELLWPHKKAVLVLLVMMLAMGMVHGAVMSAASIALILVTCGLGGVLMAIPVLSLLPVYPMVVVALPLDVFMRTYCLRFLEQFGEEYRVEWAPVRKKVAAPKTVAAGDRALDSV